MFKIPFHKFFIATPIDVLCSNFEKFVRQEIGEIVRCLPEKKFACLSSCRYFVDRAQNLPGPAPDNECCCRFHPNRLTFDGVIAERVKTAKTRHKVNPTFG